MRIAAVALALVAASFAVAVADATTASARYAEGQQAYQAQNYAVASAKFIAAYAADPDPVYLFNAAQAFRFGNECDKSAEYYEKFLAKVPNPPNADKIKVWYADMQACATRKAAPPPTAPPRSEQAIPPSDTRQPEASGGFGAKKIAAIAAAGVGLVALGVSLKYGLDGRAALKKRDELLCNMCEWDVEDQDALARHETDGRAANSKAYAFLAIGGIAVAAGVGLFVWSLGDPKTEQRVALVPALDGGYVVGSFAF